MEIVEPTVEIRPLGRPGDLGWVVQAHGEIYDAEFGWNTEFEALVARIVADYAAAHDPDREAAWIAELDGRRVGCIFLIANPDDPAVAKLRILLVHPDGRGHHLGRRLVDTCLDFARDAGYDHVRLWTNTPSEPPAASISTAASSSPTRNRTSPSASSSSARPTSDRSPDSPHAAGDDHKSPCSLRRRPARCR